MRYLFILLLITSTAYGQYVPFGANRIQDTSRTLGSVQANGGLILPLYATPDTNIVAGFDSRGRVVFRYKSGGSGTVTNVSTGFGMLGGPITTTGTVRVDSNAVMTLARGYKVSDSVALLDSTRLADTSLNLRAVFAADLADSMTVARDSVVKRVPYNGATNNLNMGNYGVTAK